MNSEETKEPVETGSEDMNAETASRKESPDAPVAPAEQESQKSDVEVKETKDVDEAEAPAEASAGKTAGDVEPAPEKKGPPLKWYVIHTYSGHENKVKVNILKMINISSIEEQFGRLIVPTEEVAEMKKGKKTITTQKFFPSYILIEMTMTDESWHLVNSIPGVTSFVGTGSKPRPLSKIEVDRILGRMDKEKQTIVPDIPFTLGEHIRIKDGPFSDFTGVIDEINAEKGKLKVLVSIFGRETPGELDFLQVETL